MPHLRTGVSTNSALRAGPRSSRTLAPSAGTAATWRRWELTSPPSWFGWVTVSRSPPLLLLATLGGAVAGQFDRTRMLGATQLAIGPVAGVTAVLTGFDMIEPGSLFTPAIGGIPVVAVASEAGEDHQIPPTAIAVPYGVQNRVSRSFGTRLD
jgi:hypothetical protein